MTIHRSMLFARRSCDLSQRPRGAARGHGQELIFGSWTPAREYQNAQVMPDMFKLIEKETNGQIKWKLVPGGQLADGKTTFTGGQGRPDPGRARDPDLCAEHGARPVHDLLDGGARAQRRGRGFRCRAWRPSISIVRNVSKR